MKAINFSLQDQNDKTISLSDFKGKKVLVYFYPKDDTPGCTVEACSLRDSFHKLEGLEVQILGISKDSVASHKKFSDKYKLNFPILSDESTETIKAYKAWGKKKFLGKEYEGIIRKSYLIDEKGEVAKTYEKVNPLTHAGEIIADVEALNK